MFCGTCGKELRDGAKFCDECGAVQPDLTSAAPAVEEPEIIQPVLAVPPKPPKPEKPKKEKKKVNKKLLAAVAIVLVLAVTAAVVVPLIFPGTETVYVLTYYTSTNADGEVTTYECEYDEFGNPLQWFYLYQQYEAKYDEYGNLTEKSIIRAAAPEEPDSEYKYTYDDEGRIETCKVYAYGNKVGSWEFTWDKMGNLIRAQMDDEAMQPYGRYPRADFVYDSKGRLIREYCFLGNYSGYEEADCYTVILFEYTYDQDGNLLTIDCGRSEETVEDFVDTDLEDISFDSRTIYELAYDEEGRLVSLEQGARGETTEYSYDVDGNLVYDNDDEFIYDDHGNLVCIEYDSGVTVEYTYEAVKMIHEAADRYRRWESIYRLSPKEQWMYPYAESFHPGIHYFFYYLVPSPVW